MPYKQLRHFNLSIYVFCKWEGHSSNINVEEHQLQTKLTDYIYIWQTGTSVTQLIAKQDNLKFVENIKTFGLEIRKESAEVTIQVYIRTVINNAIDNP